MSDDIVWNVKNGELPAVRARIEKGGIDINAIVNSRCLLHFAADNGQTEVLSYLISAGANVNSLDEYGITPLLAAVFESHEECVKILLEKGADRTRLHEGQPYIEYAETDNIKIMLKEKC